MWEKYANIKFKFVSSTDNADIRIDLSHADPTTYTYLGTMLTSPITNETGLLNTDQRSFNMHYGWFDASTTDYGPDGFSGTVLHEFGHALGLQHEHKNPINSTIRVSAYISYLTGPPNNWSEANAKSQAAFFTAQEDANYENQYTTYDPLSIMHYFVDAKFTNNNVAVGGSDKLSAGDIAFIGTVYPFPKDPTNPVDPTIGTTIYTINNSSGTPQVDVIRGNNGLISLVNRQPGNSLNSTNQKYLIFTRTKNGDWYNVAYILYSNSPLGTTTSTGITNFGPSKGESIMIERQDPGQSLGTLLFREK